MSKDKNGKEIKRLGGMLSSADFRERVITRDKDKKYAELKDLFENRQWGKLKKIGKEAGFIIDPYDELNLTPYSYDLSIGDEVFSCRTESRSSFAIGDENDKEHWHWMQPGETVIVRTKEYIALPQCYSATAWPRFNFVREGIFQSMVKTDPTWYGQLGVALTNVSPTEYPIWKEKRFATLILYELSSPTDINLFRKGQTLEVDPSKTTKEISIPHDVESKVNEAIRKSDLKGKCRIENGRLALLVVLARKELEFLRDLHESEEWKNAVEVAVRTKSCDALGLPALDLLLEMPTAGDEPKSPRRMTRERVAKAECTQEALEKAAVERGKPFDLIANMPKLTEKFARGQVEIELNKEIKGIILRIMAITVSLLGFISLVVAIIALIARYIQLEFPKELDLNGTMIAAMIIICIPVAFAVLYVFSLWTSPKGIKKINDRVARIDSAWRDEVRKIDDKYRDKILKLETRINSIKSGMK